MGEKEFAGGRWTRAKLVSFVSGALRRAHQNWPVKQDALVASRIPIEGLLKKRHPRHGHQYQCASCACWFLREDVEVDHIEECGDILEDAGAYIARMFCEEDGYQVLCKGCHAAKTQDKNHERK